MRLIAAVVLAALGSFAVACAGSDGPVEPVKTIQVTMAKSYRFSPEAIEVEPGAKVTWTNDDNFTHTVQVDGQEDHEVGRGESVSILFDAPGTYPYTCTLHSRDMDGEVIVR